eukprot:Seg709.10 transcript_id=Seg709.10/GoldUCD/mRNA.D3Y31 product="putative thiopurine S-methyltransferase" protein_id=Seg709.10/GoldUCD/D3Y31
MRQVAYRLVQLRKSIMDTSQVQKSEFTVDYWNNRWKEGQTGWHKTFTNPGLEKYFGRVVGDEKQQRILFPLCGKSLDMKWVADQGHHVTGVDGSEKAAKEFFEDNKIEYKMDAINMAPRGALVFSSLDEKIKIFVCDMYNFRSTVAGGQFNGAFDRGALVAINPKDRPKYAELMADLILPGGKILAECFEYDPTVYGGPPHHVPEQHVHEIYGKNFNVDQLEKERDITPKFKENWNIDVMHKAYYLFTRK